MPIIDINEKTQKLNFLPTEQVNVLYKPKKFDFIFAVSLHTLILVCYLVSAYLTVFMQPEPEVVEVSFGLTDEEVQTNSQQTPNQPPGQTEATKTVEQLPQLPKSAVPDTALKQEEQDQLSIQSKKEKTKVVETKEQKKPVAEKQEKNRQKVQLNDYLKRKEMDLRKEDKQKLSGVHNKDQKEPTGQKASLNKIPDSPFVNSNTLPKTPFSRVPTGSIHGKVASSYNDYRAYLGRQLKKNWNASQGSNLPPNLKT